MFGKSKIAALVAEFVGTFVLASVVLRMVTIIQIPFFAAVAAGLVVLVSVLTLGAVSGAQLNPAVTIGLWTQRKVTTTEALVYVASQMLGGLAAWKLGEWLLMPSLQDGVLPNMAGKNIDWRVIVAEGVGALVFGLGVAAAIERAYDRSQQAVAIGFSLAIAIMVASLGGNGIVNPAVAVGLHSVSTSYLVSPVLGVVVGMALYTYLLAPTPAKKTAPVKAAVKAVAKKAPAKKKPAARKKK